MVVKDGIMDNRDVFGEWSFRMVVLVFAGFVLEALFDRYLLRMLDDGRTRGVSPWGDLFTALWASWSTGSWLGPSSGRRACGLRYLRSASDCRLREEVTGLSAVERARTCFRPFSCHAQGTLPLRAC